MEGRKSRPSTRWNFLFQGSFIFFSPFWFCVCVLSCWSSPPISLPYKRMKPTKRHNSACSDPKSPFRKRYGPRTTRQSEKKRRKTSLGRHHYVLHNRHSHSVHKVPANSNVPSFLFSYSFMNVYHSPPPRYKRIVKNQKRAQAIEVQRFLSKRSARAEEETIKRLADRFVSNGVAGNYSKSSSPCLETLINLWPVVISCMNDVSPES